MKSGACLSKNYLKSEIQKLWEIILKKLKLEFPNHKFIVYIELSNHNDVTIRFQQQWKGEENYYDINNLDDYASYITY